MDNLKTYGIFIQHELGKYWTTIFVLVKTQDSMSWRYNEDIHMEYGTKSIKRAVSKAKSYIKKFNIPFIRYVEQFETIDYVDGDIENCVYEVPEPPWTT